MSVAGYFRSARLSNVRRRFSGRFATKASRFNLAVAAGFIVSAVGVLVVGADTKSGVAQSIWGAMELPDFGGSAPEPRSYEPPAPSAQYYTPHSHRERVARGSKPVHVAHGANDNSTRRHGHDQPMQLARQSICVRLCDGFVFPIGDYHGDGDRAAHEATCQSECPGAKTALFVVPQGSDSISDANQVGSGINYSELPDAFHYTTYLDETCSCHPRSGNRIKSLLHDFTLRRGDAVMTAKGLRVFHGGGSYPYKRKDFVALSKSRDIRKGDRENLKAIERASLVQPTTIANSAPPPQISSAKPVSPPALQLQAKN